MEVITALPSPLYLTQYRCREVEVVVCFHYYTISQRQWKNPYGLLDPIVSEWVKTVSIWYIPQQGDNSKFRFSFGFLLWWFCGRTLRSSIVTHFRWKRIIRNKSKIGKGNHVFKLARPTCYRMTSFFAIALVEFTRQLSSKNITSNASHSRGITLYNLDSGLTNRRGWL